jgi:hypothetical protein
VNAETGGVRVSKRRARASQSEPAHSTTSKLIANTCLVNRGKLSRPWVRPCSVVGLVG